MIPGLESLSLSTHLLGFSQSDTEKMERITDMKDELRGILEQIENLTVSLQNEGEDEKKTEIQGLIDTAETARKQIGEELVKVFETDCLSKEEKAATSTSKPEDQDVVEIQSAAQPSSSTNSDAVTIVDRSHTACGSNLRIKQPKEYKNGEDFSTYSYRFRIFVEANRTKKSDYSNALLSCVDDITLQKLMPVIENLTDRERQDIRTLLERCRETLYPKSEMRALRQQLTSAKIIQGEGEVEEFAARIRSIVNRAGYTTESDKSEACLNAFLNGLNDDLADKLYAAPDVENSFEVAVSTARKLEKMRKVRAAPATPEQETLSSVFRVAQHSDSRGSRDQHERQHRNIERSNEQQQVLSHVSNYDRQRNNSEPGSLPSNSNPQGRAGRRVRTETRSCYRCGVTGHIARFCRSTNPLNL